MGVYIWKSVVDKHSCRRDDGRHHDLHANGTSQNTVREKFQNSGSILFEEKILGRTVNRRRKTQDCLGERMQSANTAWWKDVRIYRSQDVP